MNPSRQRLLLNAGRSLHSTRRALTRMREGLDDLYAMSRDDVDVQNEISALTLPISEAGYINV